MFCTGCGKEASASDTFCRGCGRPLSDTKPVQSITYRAPTIKNSGLLGKIIAIVFVVIFVGAIIRVATVVNEGSGASPTSPPKQPSSVKAATFDEASAVIKACGKPAKDHPQELNAGAGSEGRALVYSKYNTELWFYRGPDSAQWMLRNAFLANGNDAISVEVANKRMPCMKGGLQAHFGHLEKEAAEIKHQLGLDNPVKTRKKFAGELDAQLLDMGIESKTFTTG